MAASKKKVVSQDELRRFMKEKKTLPQLSSKKIDHPLAKYNSLNQLVCVLCKTVMKNDHLWTAHIQSKQHKEKVVAVKTQGPAKPEQKLSSPLKRKSEDILQDTAKRKKDASEGKKKSLPSDFFDDDAKHKNSVRERAKAALLAGYSSSSNESDEEEVEDDRLGTNINSKKSAPSSSGLPTDFFDNGDESTGAEDKKPKAMADILPEGFFDDPKQDAKVREVEYKDKMDEEWDLFQRAMKEEAHVSEVIMEEEDEQANLDRNIDEIDDQIERWREVENLHVKRETILKTLGDGQKKGESDDEVDDEELDEFLDWRAKKSMKE